MVASLSLPRILRVGGGAVGELGDVVAGLGLHRPLLLTDAFLAGTGVAESSMTASRMGVSPGAVKSPSLRVGGLA
jgi:alcohol dehydrogenase class IV